MTRSNIATAINAAHERVEASKRAGVEAATECGRLLIEAKATVAHGGWNGWLKEHCQFSPRTAQLYMKVARYLADGDAAKAQRVADLSLREVAHIIGREWRPELMTAAKLAVATPEEAAASFAEYMIAVMPKDAFARALSLAARHKLTFGQVARAFDQVTAERRPA